MSEEMQVVGGAQEKQNDLLGGPGCSKTPYSDHCAALTVIDFGNLMLNNRNAVKIDTNNSGPLWICR